MADGFRGSDQTRVDVLAALPLERLDGLYPVRDKRDVRMVWNYLRAIGLRDTLRKIASRSGEGFRNEKFLSCGLGSVLEPGQGSSLRRGQKVVFLSPVGPACSERVVLPDGLLLPFDAHSRLPELDDGFVAFHEAVSDEAEWWSPVRGWRPESGEALPSFAASAALKEAQRLLLGLDWSAATRLPRSVGAVQTRLPAAAPRVAATRKRATLFGHGNYAKTILLPRIEQHLDVDCIHEIDPTQIPQKRKVEVAWDTAPELATDERPDAVLVAGYHHSHAGLAAEALRRGAAALVEKPLATSRQQLHELLAVMRSTGGDVFSGYQRRYLPFNDWAREDLEADPGDPISYHAIVYEVPLPELHWYRWPNSRSRLLSNGCHWVDHFLFLNDYAAPSEFDVRAAGDGTVNCSVSLENGAFFSMVLTHQGSRRLGVRDHVELRAGGATAKIEDACRYESENRERVIRRGKIRRLESYERMYDTIGRKIAAGEPGDSVLSMQRSAGLVLDLHDQLIRQDPKRRFPSPAAVPFAPRAAVEPTPLRWVAPAA